MQLNITCEFEIRPSRNLQQVIMMIIMVSIMIIIIIMMMMMMMVLLLLLLLLLLPLTMLHFSVLVCSVSESVPTFVTTYWERGATFARRASSQENTMQKDGDTHPTLSGIQTHDPLS